MATRKPAARKPAGKKPAAGKPAAKGSNRRVTVEIGSVKKKVGGTEKSVKLYSFMKKSTADYFGFTQVKKIPTSAASSGTSGGAAKKPARLLRGSSGAGSIKLVAADGSSKSIPVPSGFPLQEIEKFIKKAKSNKPIGFVTKNGKYFGINTASK